MYITDNNNLATIVLLIGLVFITSLYVAYRNKVLLLMSSLFSQRHLSQLLREGKLSNKNLFLWVQGVIVIVQSLFLFVILQYYFPKIFNQIDQILLYLILIGVVLIDYLLKRGFNYLYMNLFNSTDEISIYTLYKLLFNFINTIALIAIIPISLYSGYWKLIILYIPFFIISFSMTSFKLFTITSNSIKLFQFFIYFCTLEILPYIVVLKLLIHYGK